ncbi:hypothetical protein [Catenibacillus scindens]|uniref:hypothetical protein n=1 Tax=Catenibacillus scindens TaxID=673271 RepID=UPI003208F092
MKKKARCILSVFMAVLMVFSCTLATAFAGEVPPEDEDGEMAAIVLAEAFEDQIVLEADEDYAYAIQITQDQDTIWQWAEKSQYDEDKGTVVFDGLKAGTEYIFARCLKSEELSETIEIDEKETAVFRTKDVEDDTSAADTQTETSETESKETEQTETKESETKESETKETESKETEESETKAPDNGEIVTKERESKESDRTKIQKSKDQVPVNALTTKPETKTPESVQPQSVEPETKTPESVQPESAEPETKTPESVQPESAESETKQPEYENETKSEPETETQIPETQPLETESPETKNPETEAPKPIEAKAPGAPVLVSVTDTQISAGLAEGTDGSFCYEFSINGKDYQDSPTFSSLSPDTDYIVTARVKAGTYGDQVYDSGKPSQGLSVHTLKSAAPAPAAPQLSERTENSLTVVAVSGQEYALWTDGKAGAWQTGGQFAGLNTNTTYAVVTRMAYDPAIAMESQVSAPLNVKTFIAFEGSAIGGVTADATYEAGTSFTITASGTGMANGSPSVGDSRWRPQGWQWGSGSQGTWSEAPFEKSFTVIEAGKYTINVTFGLETYTDKGWEAVGAQNMLTTSFNVIAKEFTMKATAAKGGTVTPSGTMKITQGKDYTFTMTADKNYKISKVYIDGKEAAVQGNQYTFTKVNGDHSIYVVFERTDGIDTPKTGDDTPVWALWTVIGISLLAIIVVAAIRVKKSLKK